MNLELQIKVGPADWTHEEMKNVGIQNASFTQEKKKCRVVLLFGVFNAACAGWNEIMNESKREIQQIIINSSVEGLMKVSENDSCNLLALMLATGYSLSSFTV